MTNYGRLETQTRQTMTNAAFVATKTLLNYTKNEKIMTKKVKPQSIDRTTKS